MATLRSKREIDDDPILLREAAVALPNGSMAVSGLRRMAKRGLLWIWKIGDGYYTSLGVIKEMLTLCDVGSNGGEA